MLNVTIIKRKTFEKNIHFKCKHSSSLLNLNAKTLCRTFQLSTCHVSSTLEPRLKVSFFFNFIYLRGAGVTLVFQDVVITGEIYLQDLFYPFQGVHLKRKIASVDNFPSCDPQCSHPYPRNGN